MISEAEHIAREFHEAYERLAPSHGRSRDTAATPWDDVPEPIKALKVATVQDLLDAGVIS